MWALMIHHILHITVKRLGQLQHEFWLHHNIVVLITYLVITTSKMCKVIKSRSHKEGAGHFGHKTLRHRDTLASQNWCRSLRRITGGAVSHLNCPRSKCPGFSSITALVSKCLVPRFWCRSVLRSVPKCPRVS